MFLCFRWKLLYLFLTSQAVPALSRKLLYPPEKNLNSRFKTAFFLSSRHQKTPEIICNLGFLFNGNRLDNSEVLYGPMSFQWFQYMYFPTLGMGFQQLLRWRCLAVDLQYTTVRLRRPHSIDGMDLPSYCLHGHNSIQYQSRHKVLLSHGHIRNTVLHDIQVHPIHNRKLEKDDLFWNIWIPQVCRFSLFLLCRSAKTVQLINIRDTEFSHMQTFR